MGNKPGLNDVDNVISCPLLRLCFKEELSAHRVLCRKVTSPLAIKQGLFLQ